jgi:polysaccharide export outer membrane protein
MRAVLLRSYVMVAVFVFAPGAISCAGPGEYVWYNQLSPEALAASGEYSIDIGDVVDVRVLGHEDMTTHVRVRADGRIALPIIGEVDARGKGPDALRAEIETRLKDFFVRPSVTLNIAETAAPTISILGEVARPGVFPLTPNTRLADALALGGGLTDYASRDRIFVVRTSPKPARIRFTYEAVSRGDALAAFRLRPGDMIVVE